MGTTIVGAGMAGCIAAYMIPSAQVIERHEGPPDNHRAVLRFRDDSVSRVTGIPFRKVRVHKGVYSNGKYQTINPRLANLYSQKVLGSVSDRSIWNLDPVNRYVAPTDFHMQMLEQLDGRIIYNTDLSEIMGTDEQPNTIISTMPMDRMATLMSHEFESKFNFRKTYTYNAIVEDCDVHCTTYYPGFGLGPYRASITGNRLIVECVREITHTEKVVVCDSLGIDYQTVIWYEQEYTSTYGKIAKINEQERRAFILNLTLKHNIYSLGRFGTWRNVLLDDVVDDVEAIKSMIDNGAYHALLRSGK